MLACCMAAVVPQLAMAVELWISPLMRAKGRTTAFAI